MWQFKLAFLCCSFTRLKSKIILLIYLTLSAWLYTNQLNRWHYVKVIHCRTRLCTRARSHKRTQCSISCVMCRSVVGCATYPLFLYRRSCRYAAFISRFLLSYTALMRFFFPYNMTSDLLLSSVVWLVAYSHPVTSSLSQSLESWVPTTFHTLSPISHSVTVTNSPGYLFHLTARYKQLLSSREPNVCRLITHILFQLSSCSTILSSVIFF